MGHSIIKYHDVGSDIRSSPAGMMLSYKFNSFLHSYNTAFTSLIPRSVDEQKSTMCKIFWGLGPQNYGNSLTRNFYIKII